jgi:hypothetical protein
MYSPSFFMGFLVLWVLGGIYSANALTRRGTATAELSGQVSIAALGAGRVVTATRDGSGHLVWDE